MPLRYAHYRRAFKNIKTMKNNVRITNRVVLFLCSLLITGSLPVFGQVWEELVLPFDELGVAKIDAIGTENTTLKSNLSTLDLNTVTLQQMGNLNQATIIQISGQSDPNLVNVFQNGDLNNTVVMQAGQRNAVDVQQLGNSNHVVGIYGGEDLISSIYQQGDENLVVQSLDGSNMDFHISQLGHRNEVYQQESGDAGKGYSVLQNGSDMKVIISQEYVLRH